MEGLQRMANSITYMEDHLTEELRIEDIAAVACMSKFHFQRLFGMLTGFTVSEYIRNRRITLAVQELIHTNAKVIDVAMKYQYDSPESFTKAFQRIHGLSPTAAKKNSQFLKAYPRLSFQIQMKGDVEMEYRLEEKEAFSVIGKSIRTRAANGQNHRDTASFWEETNKNGFARELSKHSGKLGLLGICFDFDQQQENLSYMIASEKGNAAVPGGLEEKVIPSAVWAIFPVKGAMPDAIQKVWERIFSEWLPSTGYEHTGGAELEVYPHDGDPASADYYSEIWIPVKKA